MVGYRAKINSQFLDFWDLIQVCFCYSCIYLKFYSSIFSQVYTSKCTVKCTIDSPEAVMAFFCRTIQAYTYSFYSGIRHFLGRLFCYHCSVWSHNHPQAFICTVTRYFKNIRSKQRFSACKYDYWLSDFCYLIKKLQRGFCVKFVTVWTFCG